MRLMKISCLAMGFVALPVTTLPMTALADTHTVSAETAKESDIVATVNGMVCDFCARAVSKVFGKNAAIDTVHVDLDAGEIHVDLKPGATLDDETVGQLVKKSGYTLVSVARAGV